MYDIMFSKLRIWKSTFHLKIGEGIGTRYECPFEIRSYVEFPYVECPFGLKSPTMDHRVWDRELAEFEGRDAYGYKRFYWDSSVTAGYTAI